MWALNSAWKSKESTLQKMTSDLSLKGTGGNNQKKEGTSVCKRALRVSIHPVLFPALNSVPYTHSFTEFS